MIANLAKVIYRLGEQMRLIRAAQEGGNGLDRLTERDELILGLLSQKGPMVISEIAAAIPNVSVSTISLNITKLWRGSKLVSKKISPENQRMTFVELTNKGKESIEKLKSQRDERFNIFYEALNVNDSEKEFLNDIFNRAAIYLDKKLSSMNTNAGNAQE